MGSNIVEEVYAAKKRVINIRYEIFKAKQADDKLKMARLQRELIDVKVDILNRYNVIIDY